MLQGNGCFATSFNELKIPPRTHIHTHTHNHTNCHRAFKCLIAFMNVFARPELALTFRAVYTVVHSIYLHIYSMYKYSICMCVFVYVFIFIKPVPDESDTVPVADSRFCCIGAFFLQCFRFEFTFHFAENAPKEPTTTYPTEAQHLTLPPRPPPLLISSLN